MRSSALMKSSLALLCIALLAPGIRAQRAHARGYLFIVGGGPQPPALVQRFVDLAGGGKAKIVVFGMASSGGKQGGEEKADDLRKLGAEAHAYFIDPSEANSDALAKNMEGVTGVWFGGGAQLRRTKARLRRRVEQAIHDRSGPGAGVGLTHRGGAGVAGHGWRPAPAPPTGWLGQRCRRRLPRRRRCSRPPDRPVRTARTPGRPTGPARGRSGLCANRRCGGTAC